MRVSSRVTFLHNSGLPVEVGIGDAQIVLLGKQLRVSQKYNVLTSMAGVNNEVARSRYLDNKKKGQESDLQGTVR